MKYSLFFLFLYFLTGILLNACATNNKSDDNNGDIPDAYFSIEISGDHNDQIEVTIPNGVQTDFSVVGSHHGQTSLLLINFQEIVQGGWSLGLKATASQLSTGNFSSNQQGDLDASIYGYNPEVGFKSTSAGITISKAQFFVETQGLSQYFIDGTFSGTFVEINPEEPDQPRIVNIEGSFSGIPVMSTP